MKGSAGTCAAAEPLPRSSTVANARLEPAESARTHVMSGPSRRERTYRWAESAGCAPESGPCRRLPGSVTSRGRPLPGPAVTIGHNRAGASRDNRRSRRLGTSRMTCAKVAHAVGCQGVSRVGAGHSQPGCHDRPTRAARPGYGVRASQQPDTPVVRHVCVRGWPPRRASRRQVDSGVSHPSVTLGDGDPRLPGVISRSTHPPHPPGRTPHMSDSAQARPTVAVIGAGVSGPERGLRPAAHPPRHALRGRRPARRPRAHPRRHARVTGRTAAVDSGFIVLNDRTYPQLRRLFAELGVQTRPTEMSMSITCDGCGLGYVGGRGPNGIFAQRRRLLDPLFWRLLLQVRRFQKAALALLEDAASALTLRRVPRPASAFDEHFVTHYALPVVSCVWSMGHQEALDYPAAYLFAFLRNHGFLVLGDAPTWHTVVGGSPQLRRGDRRPARRGPRGHPGDRASAASRTACCSSCERRARRDTARFDKVVVATHADAALAPAHRRHRGRAGGCSAPSATPRTVAYLHRDESFLPARRRGRASWNYRLEALRRRQDRPRGLLLDEPAPGPPEADPLVVTLNPDDHASAPATWSPR